MHPTAGKRQLWERDRTVVQKTMLLHEHTRSIVFLVLVRSQLQCYSKPTAVTISWLSQDRPRCSLLFEQKTRFLNSLTQNRLKPVKINQIHQRALELAAELQIYATLGWQVLLTSSAC